MAVLVVLEAMTPAERVAFVLHDVFQYSFAEVGEIVGRTAEASRQLASTARRRVRGVPPHGGGRRGACRRGRIVQVGVGDRRFGGLDQAARPGCHGGGRRRRCRAEALPKPIHGADRIAWTLSRLTKIQPDIAIEATVVNGEAGLVLKSGDELLAVVSFSVTAGRIDRIWTMRNPEKLTAW